MLLGFLLHTLKSSSVAVADVGGGSDGWACGMGGLGLTLCAALSHGF